MCASAVVFLLFISFASSRIKEPTQCTIFTVDINEYLYLN
jgi:hypothetical protein